MKRTKFTRRACWAYGLEALLLAAVVVGVTAPPPRVFAAAPVPPEPDAMTPWAVIFMDGTYFTAATPEELVEHIDEHPDDVVLWAGFVTEDQCGIFRGLRPRLCTHVRSFGAES
jgi:hypothetical protein